MHMGIDDWGRGVPSASVDAVEVSIALGCTGRPATVVGACEVRNSSRSLGVRDSRGEGEVNHL